MYSNCSNPFKPSQTFQTFSKTHEPIFIYDLYVCSEAWRGMSSKVVCGVGGGRRRMSLEYAGGHMLVQALACRSAQTKRHGVMPRVLSFWLVHLLVTLGVLWCGGRE